MSDAICATYEPIRIIINFRFLFYIVAIILYMAVYIIRKLIKIAFVEKILGGPAKKKRHRSV